MVPGGVMCAPTLTDITRAWAILEYFRTNWLEPIWLGCSLERYEEIQSYEDFQKWLNEDVKHRESDLGLYWRMGLDIGLDRYGAGVGKYVTWGYIPHEDKYNHPTIEGRNAAVIMKSGVYDSFTDTHSLMNQSFAFSPEAEGSEKEAATCMVCFDNQPDIVILDCGHGGICYSCAIDIWK